MGGVPLVFLHAFPLSAKMWDVNAPAFEKHFRFISIDLPGFGSAPLSSSTSSMESMAEFALDQIKKAGVQEKFVAAGLSMGGYVLLQMLKLAPDRIRGAAFLSTRSAADSPEARDRRYKNIDFIEKNGVDAFADRMVQTLLGKTTLGSNAALIDRVKGMIRSQKSESVCAALRGMAERPDMTAVLDDLKIPAFFLAGGEDVVIPATEMEAMAQRVKKGRFRIISGAGHLTNLEKPNQFNDEFLHFLKSSVL